jgi:serine/threonine protein kinase
VYKGSYFGTTVAIKKIKIPNNDADLMRFLKREVVILKTLRHPHIVQFVGVCKHGNSLLLITEYAQGGDLHQCLKESSLQGLWKTKVTLSQQIGSAMAYLHSKSVVFRDMKAKNVLVNDKNRPTQAKLCDFGFARVLTKVDGPRNNTNYLTICGTDDWMAPEVILGMDYDEKSDVFSYGILLLEMIIGTKVLKRDLKRSPMTGFELDLNRVRTLAPRSCPQKFLELAIFCCEYQPKNRPDFKSIVMAIVKTLQDPAVVDLTPEQYLASYSGDKGIGGMPTTKKEPQPLVHERVVSHPLLDPEASDSGFNSSLTMHIKSADDDSSPKSPNYASTPNPTLPILYPPPATTSQSTVSPPTTPPAPAAKSSWVSVLDQIVGFFGPSAPKS